MDVPPGAGEAADRPAIKICLDTDNTWSVKNIGKPDLSLMKKVQDALSELHIDAAINGEKNPAKEEQQKQQAQQEAAAKADAERQANEKKKEAAEKAAKEKAK